MTSNLSNQLRRVTKLIDEGKHEKAISLLTDLVLLHPDEPRIYNDLAMAFDEIDNTNRAVEVLRVGCDRLPDNFDLQFELAYSLLRNNNPEEAEQVYRKLLLSDADNSNQTKSMLYSGLGEALWDQGKEDEAIELWQTALELDPDNDNASMNLIEHTEGIELPGTPQWIKENAGLIEAVIACVVNSSKERFVTDNEEHVVLVKDQYEIAMRLAGIIKSKDMLYDLMDMTIYDIFAWLFELPFTLARFGMVDEAVQVGNKWAEITDADIFLGDQCVVLAEAGLQDQVLQHIEKLLTAFPDNVWVRIKIGDAYFELEEWEQAEKSYYDALSIPDNEDGSDAATGRLITLYRRLGRHEEADKLEDQEIENQESVFYEEDLFPEDIAVPAPVTSRGKIGRNEPCPCGSGKKYKKCCGR